MKTIEQVMIKLENNNELHINFESDTLLFVEVKLLYQRIQKNKDCISRVTINGTSGNREIKAYNGEDVFNNYSMYYYIKSINLLIELHYDMGSISLEFLNSEPEKYDKSIFIKICNTNEYLKLSAFISLIKTMHEFKLYKISDWNKPLGKYINLEEESNLFELYYSLIKNKYKLCYLRFESFFTLERK